MQPFHTRPQILQHPGEEVAFVLSIMRQHIGHAQIGHRGKHRLVLVSTRDVVHNLHAIGLHTPTGHTGTERIDAHHGVWCYPTQHLEPPLEPTYLLSL